MMKLFDAYRKQNTEPNHDNYCDVNYLLRLWKENKGQYLAPLFGDNLILEKEVEYERGRDQLREDMYRMIRDEYAFTDRLFCAIRDNTLNEHDRNFENVLDNLVSCLRNSDRMVDNNLYLGYTEYCNDRGRWDYKDIKSYTLEFENGHKVQLQAGMKITRAFTQICAQLNMSQDWEAYRIKHSQVLNQKKLKGTLCLSIHPLDFATASDNDNGWSSCMSWREEGCYRMGTVEMMNSPMVICAYLRSDKQHMEIRDDESWKEWNSKKWRAWIIVTKDVIICNRHYPYHQENFAIKAIEWVQELVGKAYGWEYEDIHTDFIAWMRDEAEYEVEFRTNYMYNDIGGDDVIGCFKKNWSPIHMPGYINFSGPAECMVCGDEIPYNVQEADTLMCSNCRIFTRCEECGCELDEDQCYTGPDGYTYCEECYSEIFRECEECGTVENRDNCMEITIPVYKEAFAKWVKETFDTDDPEYIPSRTHPAYRAWYHQHWNAGRTSGSVWVCETCAQRLNTVTIPYRNEEITMPDPNKHDMKSAFDLANPDDWHWANHINEISWVDDEDRASAAHTMKLYKILWDCLVEKYNKYVQDLDNN